MEFISVEQLKPSFLFLQLKSQASHIFVCLQSESWFLTRLLIISACVCLWFRHRTTSACSFVAARSWDWRAPSCSILEICKTHQRVPLPSTTQRFPTIFLYFLLSKAAGLRRCYWIKINTDYGCRSGYIRSKNEICTSKSQRTNVNLLSWVIWVIPAQMSVPPTFCSLVFLSAQPLLH